MAGTPWDWRSPLEPWFDSIEPRLESWQPAPELATAVPELHDALRDAVGTRAGWLWHPCAASLTVDSRTRWQRDLQLVLWTAANCRLAGTVSVPAASRGWGTAGSRDLAAGSLDLAGGDAPAAEPPASAVDLDLWCTSVGEPIAGSWADRPPEDDREVDELEQGLRQFVRATTFLDEQLPACRDWLAARTRVALALRSVAGASRSISFPDVPAVVGLDLASDVMVLESLVHETAHVNLYLAEIVGPLVDPADDGRFPSPLRPDLRPLRGILMAYHALAFVGALYRDALAATGAALFEEQLASSLELARDAELTLIAERHRLTASGADFLERTQDVMAYAGR